MTIKQLRRIEQRLYSIRNQLKESEAKHPELNELRDLIGSSWTKSYELLKQLKLDEAEKRDAGEILWTIFRPMLTAAGRKVGISEYIRTPNRIGKRYFFDEFPDRNAEQKIQWDLMHAEFSEMNFEAVMRPRTIQITTQ